MARAAARERSITRPLVNGPRSVIFTVTERPLRRFTTSTSVPNGRVRWPAVKAPASKISPLAVRFFRSYQAASPRPRARFGAGASASGAKAGGSAASGGLSASADAGLASP
jgi:hypothetical protein